MSDQEAPITAYPATSIEAQDQSGGPGFDKDTKQKAEWTRLEFWDENQKPYLKEYEGRGLLQGKAALITGGDSGIGRAVAILFAREGADVSIVYLPEEEEDAQYVKKKVEEAGRKANLMQFDLKERKNCEAAVEGHMKAFGKLNVLVNNGKFILPLYWDTRVEQETDHVQQPQCKKCARTSRISISTSPRRLFRQISSPCLPCQSTRLNI
jgi:hypothetical protein